MNDRFLKIDIDAVTFRGLSASLDRKIALFNTALIWFSSSVVLLYFASRIEPNGLLSFFFMLAMTLSILDYILNSRFIPYSLAQELVRYMPISALYKKDKQVLDIAKTELFAVANQVRFEDYLVYSKINPDIRSKESIRVMIAQRKGKLDQWIKQPRHLKKLANLVYQIYLVEQFIQQDMDRF